MKNEDSNSFLGRTIFMAKGLLGRLSPLCHVAEWVKAQQSILRNTGQMASEFSRGPKIHTKRSLCGEFKYTFKVRITELYLKAIETNRDPEKLKFWAWMWPIFEINSICYPINFFKTQYPFGFLFSLSHMQSKTAYFLRHAAIVKWDKYYIPTLSAKSKHFCLCLASSIPEKYASFFPFQLYYCCS